MNKVTPLIKLWLLRFLKSGMLCVVLLLALVAALRVEHTFPVELPVPTGPFAVGRLTTVWADDQHIDSLAPTPGQRRELLAWIWYPASPDQSVADYLPPPVRAEVDHNRGPVITRFLTRDLSRVRSHSIRDADLSAARRSYPVAIMRAGASSEVWNYSALAEDLASHGYVVVGFDAPYRTSEVVFPDGRAIKRTPENNPELCAERPLPQQAGCVNKLLTAWTSDVAFAVDRLEQWNASDPSGKFTGRLDMARVGVFGHSFGGATALQFCHDDPRCKAGIDLDGQPFGSVVQEGLHQPFMFVLTEQAHSSDPETRQVLANIQSIYDRLPADGRQRLLIRGANHFLFSDDGALLKSHIVMGALRVIGVLGIDGRRQLAVTTHCVHSFFDTYLKEERVSISSPLYPEVQWLP